MSVPRDALPEALSFTFHGEAVRMYLLPDRNGYRYRCPGCGHDAHWIRLFDAGGGPCHEIRAVDPLTIGGAGGLSDSLACVCRDYHPGREPCRWHVFIRDGVAIDCG